jgi:two-component system, NtrC family, response regulator AtoC
MTHPILVVDDDRSTCELLAEGLAPHGFKVTFTTEPTEAEALVSERPFDAVLTDMRMRGLDGIELCSRLVALRPSLPVLVITAFGRFEAAVAAIRAGAYDFLTKPLDIEVAAVALERALRHRALALEMVDLKRRVEEGDALGELVGESAEIEAVRKLVARAAPTDTSVLFSGESGTGKGLFARALHDASERRQGPFVSINCAALPEGLLESELFGHARGAFTDARTAREGLMVRAAGGTLFLDEIGELPLGLQPKLLRALQERVIRPVGSDREQSVDLRIVTATNVDLEAAVRDKRFREDLYYRVNVLHVRVPPLRERPGDVMLLANRFLEKLAVRTRSRARSFTDAAARAMNAYAWPGNVRELGNCVERALVLAQGDAIDVKDLPEKLRGGTLPPSPVPVELVALAEIERRHVLRVLEAVGGNKVHAAGILGLDRKTLYRRLELYARLG